MTDSIRNQHGSLQRFIHRWLSSDKLRYFVVGAREGEIADTVDVRDEDGELLGEFEAETLADQFEQAASDFAASARQPARFVVIAQGAHDRVLANCPFTVLPSPTGLARRGGTGMASYERPGLLGTSETYFDQELQESIVVGVTHQSMRHVEGMMKLQLNAMNATMGHMAQINDRLMDRLTQVEDRAEESHLRNIELHEHMRSEQHARDLEEQDREAARETEKRREKQWLEFAGMAKDLGVAAALSHLRTRDRKAAAGLATFFGIPWPSDEPASETSGDEAAGATAMGEDDPAEPAAPTAGRTAILLHRLFGEEEHARTAVITKIYNALDSAHQPLLLEVLLQMRGELNGEAVPPATARAVVQLRHAIGDSIARLAVLLSGQQAMAFMEIYTAAEQELKERADQGHAGADPPTATP